MHPELALTGERTVPGAPGENYWFRRHQAAYLLSRDAIAGPRLLEVGAGEGYGAALLAERVPVIYALDYDRASIQHLARRYPELHPVRANLAALPFADASMDTVLSLQVIEHVWDHPQFIAECRRVLRPDGLLVLSTPNRLTFSPGLDRPLNPFHTHEFTAAELSRLIVDGGMNRVAVRGLRAGPRLRALDAGYAASGGLVSAQLSLAPAQWSARLRADVDSVTTADFGMVDSDLDESLDLIVLARRP